MEKKEHEEGNIQRGGEGAKGKIQFGLSMVLKVGVRNIQRFLVVVVVVVCWCSAHGPGMPRSLLHMLVNRIS